MNLRFWILLGLAAALFHSHPVGAFTSQGTYPSGSRDVFSDLDHNRDGRLNRSNEWHGDLRSFDVKDCNRDGWLTRGEFSSKSCSVSYSRDNFSNLDHNRDGRISKFGEWHENYASFDQKDCNRDGYLNRDEFFSTCRFSSQEAAFLRMDLNHDGRIARAEWRGNSERFWRSDLNRDGYLNRGEFNYSRKVGFLGKVYHPY